MDDPVRAGAVRSVSHPDARIIGYAYDLNGQRIPVGVCDGTVLIGIHHLDRDQAEEFARLFVRACWDAEASAQGGGT
jgi:hypothetical protein